MRKMALLLLIAFAAANAHFVGSKNSDKYHDPSCEWAQKISPQNLVAFEDAEEAAVAGYVPCKVCKPGGGSAYIGQSTEKSQSKAASGGQCQAFTKKGTQCKRKASAGSLYCWQHQ
jgi:methylphosphotriester-DNA--protein-cysteine methyltransferase